MPRSDAEEKAARYADFEQAYSRTVEQRLNHGLIHTFKPGLDDGPAMRSWDSLAEYRQWCEENLEQMDIVELLEQYGAQAGEGYNIAL